LILGSSSGTSAFVKRFIQRPRRLRGNAALRDAVADFSVRPANLMLPVFVAESADADPDIQFMPGVKRHTIRSLGEEIAELCELGLRSFILFGIPNQKDARASGAFEEDSVVARALREVRARCGDDVFLATDVCVCSYTDHGHCGLLTKSGDVDNDPSVELLGRMALCHAQAGADMVAPSDMMDGRVRHIRDILDANGFSALPIMSYAVKYASSFYGPFRYAAESAPKFGDRRGYQMDFRNSREALVEASLDEREGADVLMVKPAQAYLDIIRDLRAATSLPLAAYQVSGEYAMVRYAAAAGAVDERAICVEQWTGLRRAGASIILTYHAAQAIRERWLES